MHDATVAHRFDNTSHHSATSTVSTGWCMEGLSQEESMVPARVQRGTRQVSGHVPLMISLQIVNFTKGSTLVKEEGSLS